MNAHGGSFDLLTRIRRAVIGDATSIPGPFGPRPLIYADYTASGRSLDFIERVIAEKVLPYYANTHTETSYSGLQTTRFREQARQAIREAVGADQRHAVIFTGSGATAAINKLAWVLGLRQGHPGKQPRAVVFIGPYEHHSNELVWRESSAEVVRIPLDAHGGVDMEALERELVRHEGYELKLGSFSAASNVTGIRTDLRRLAILLHRHGACFVSDFAAAAPYVDIRIGESGPGAKDHIDAIFLSPHKFPGGPGASGVLIADRRLFANEVPSVPGGGTVAYVTATRHRYVEQIERREEAGTPSIIGDIRAGLVMALKSAVGAEQIESLERALVAKVRNAWKANSAIALLGPADHEQLAVFAFNIIHQGSFLHPNFVVAALNDLFGVQARGGCSCAGPYAHELLEISDTAGRRYQSLVESGLNFYRPGWVRLNFNYFLDPLVVDYIIGAVDFVARRGADLLPLYRCEESSGRWFHREGPAQSRLGFEDLCSWKSNAGGQAEGGGLDARGLGHYLLRAEEIADSVEATSDAPPEMLRWLG